MVVKWIESQARDSVYAPHRAKLQFVQGDFEPQKSLNLCRVLTVVSEDDQGLLIPERLLRYTGYLRLKETAETTALPMKTLCD